MAAGMPSVGIGGLFYLASTLLLPLRRGWRRLRGERDTTPSAAIAHALLIAFGMIAGIWLTGVLLGYLLPAGMLPTTAPASSTGGGIATHNVVRWATVAAGFVTLVVVLLAVEVARLVQRRRRVRV